MDTLHKEILNVLNFFESSQIPLRKGLYLCYLKLHSTINTIRVVVPHNVPSMLPYVFIRFVRHWLFCPSHWQTVTVASEASDL